MGAIIFILMVVVIPIMPSGGSIPRWAFLSLAAAGLFMRTEIGWIGLGVAVYLGLMSFVTPIGYDAALILWHFLVYLVLFLYAQRMGSLRNVAIGAGLAVGVNSIVVVAQVFGWQGIPQVERLSGLYYNHNMAAEAAAMTFALVICHQLWWLLPGLLPTLMSGSRAAIFGIGLMGLAGLWRWSRFAAILCVLGSALIVETLIHGEGLGVGSDLIQRFGVWFDTAAHLNLLGHGLGSFIGDYPAFQRGSLTLALRFENTHNDYLQIMYELGLVGLLGIVALLMRMRAVVIRGPEWYALVVYLGIAVWGFPLYESVTGSLTALCAGRLFAECHSLRDLLRSRRSGVWFGAQELGFAPFPAREQALSTDALAPLLAWVFGDRAQRSFWNSLRQRGAKA